MQQSHRRSTKVCTRCRKRKTKCDYKFPACTPCKVAKATCLGYDPVTKEAVPRSLVKSLEARVADLETQVLAFRAAPQNTPYMMASMVAQATLSFGIPSSLSYLDSRLSSALLFQPSCPPLAVVRDREQLIAEKAGPSAQDEPISLRHGIYSSNSLINLNSVPLLAIKRMIQNYVDIHLPQYPCISESLLEGIVERIQQRGYGGTNSPLSHDIISQSGLGDFEYFVLFVVLAISSMTLTWKNEDKARAGSASFYNSALKHVKALQDHDELQALQISLLLAHYAHMCPERADNWTCITNAVRIVLNLGLHKECPEPLGIDQVQLRTKLFWVTYGMERSLCSNLRLPLSFPEESITAKFDVTLNKRPVDTLLLTDDMVKRSSANHIYRYRALETEVHRFLHLEEDLQKFGSTTVSNWIEDITHRLAAWYSQAQAYTQYTMLEFKHVQFHHLRARIHRPTPRLRTRTPEDRRIVLESCLVLIEDYISQELRRRLFYPWHGTHILFEAAVISLEACWSCRNQQPLREQANQMLASAIPQCLQLLTSIGTRWNEAALCADRLHPLVQKITSNFAEPKSQSSFLDDASITEEVQSLLFSEEPLTWNHAIQDIGCFDFEYGPAISDEMILDDMDIFRWDPEWDMIGTEPV